MLLSRQFVSFVLNVDCNGRGMGGLNMREPADARIKRFIIFISFIRHRNASGMSADLRSACSLNPVTKAVSYWRIYKGGSSSSYRSNKGFFN
jgi:hypothetical protein